MHQPVDFGDREAADHSDVTGLGHRAGDDAGQVGRILDIVVEHGEVRICRIVEEGRAQQERGVRIVEHDLAGFLFHPEDLTDDQLYALFGIFAHHARIVGIGGVLGEGVGDLARRLGRFGGDMDAADPLLFDRHGIDAGDTDGLLRQKTAWRDEAGSGCGAARTEQKLTAVKARAGLVFSRHGFPLFRRFLALHFSTVSRRLNQSDATLAEPVGLE